MTLLVVALLAGCGGGSSSGPGGTATSAPSGGSTSASTSGASKATSSTNPGNVPSHSTQARSTKAATSKDASVAVGGHLLRSYAGSGNMRLGTIVASSPTVLVWRAQRPAIQIFTEHGFILVSSHASGGSVQLTRGAYPGTRVATHGAWSIELRTRSR
jgi:hypothetical protein